MKTGHAGNGKHTRRTAPEAHSAGTERAAQAAPGAQPPTRMACVSLYSRPGKGESLSAVLPLGLLGLDVKETLHRFDANAHAPGLERGVSGANRVGEPLGTLAMHWRLAPDGFEATPGCAPPETELRSSSSQRFVMQDGVITFQERGHGTLRFFGAGRTYPSTTDGQQRLLFAGTAVVVEGAGSLKGVRGTLMLSGEITSASAMAVNVVGRFEAGGPVSVEDALGPLIDLTDAAVPATLLTFVGDRDGHGIERLRISRLGCDLANASRLRSVFRVGDGVGSVHGPLAFDETDVRCSVPLDGASRVLSFSDSSGRPIGTITAANLEGTAALEAREGQTVRRVVAYGAASGGTGALAGAGGVLTFEADIEPSGRATTLYALRLTDPAGRFRAAYSDRVRTPARATDGAPPAPATALQFVEDGLTMTDADRAVVRHADRTMVDGAELLRWWEAKDRVGDYTERFDVVREYSGGNHSYSFFDTAVINNAGLPVMGIVQEMFYDRPKIAPAAAVRDQLREFVLRYFLRVSHVRQPDATPGSAHGTPSTIENLLSWLPSDNERRAGMRYQQLYYKLRESGKVGKFEKEKRSAVVDLREMGDVYDWILLKVDIFNFNLSFAPLGAGAPSMQLPLKESAYLILGPPFVRNEDSPEPGVVGRYGFCYAFVPVPPPDGPPLVAYGPGHFAAAIQTFDFTLRSDGEIRVNAAFVVSRPDKIAKMDIAPLDWGLKLADKVTFGTASRLMRPLKAMADRLPLSVSGVDPVSTYVWMANAMTGGLAARRFGISKLSLEKKFLLQHFVQHYEMLNTSALSWRLVADWTDHERLPPFCREGVA